MAFDRHDPTNHYVHELGQPPPASPNTYGIEEVDDGAMAHLIDDRERTFHLQDISFTAPKSPIHQPALSPLGKPTMKKILHISDAFAAGVSLICLALAIVVVANTNVSWRLGVGNYQLIVIGFLLSIMNLCLAMVVPTLFLLLEANFGSSILQNYDAILRNRPLASRLSIVWRAVLGLMLVLPIGLSIAYKTFTGGESALEIDTMDYISNISNATYYGMFPPPGLLSLGFHSGISIFFNATLPFLVASSLTSNGSEPPLPTYPQHYGFNILSLNNESTAVLDILQPEYVTAVQGLLALGESWRITAPVTATVATLNRLKTEDPGPFNSAFMLACNSANWSLETPPMHNFWSLVLLEQINASDQSVQYIGLAPETSISCSELSQYTQLYNVNRQLCEGTWSVTRGGIQLANGSCNGTILPLDKQQMILNQEQIGGWYLSSLMEVLAPFIGAGNQSAWFVPSMSTSVAAMVWSRISGLDALYSMDWPGMVYPVNQTVLYIRPTLRNTGLLYLVIAIQPLLVAVILVVTVVFHSTPLDSGFGLVSILSGVDRQSLDSLAGATLSGELTQPVKLIIGPVKYGQEAAIEYRIIASPSAPGSVRNRKLSPNVIYH